VRAQITQIEKYNSAVNTFKGKFDGLPGDLQFTLATQFGFGITSCDGTFAFRDGNGLIDGWVQGYVILQFQNEVSLFWQDLSSKVAGNLINGTFTHGRCAAAPANLSGTGVTAYLPIAAIGYGNFVYVYDYSGSNWYGVSAVTGSNAGTTMISNANISVRQAYNMDAKVDDGLPLTGNVQALYINNTQLIPIAAPNTATFGGTASSCYDTTTSTYSVTVNNGNGGNCALSFKFQ
jgi:hypothetical protein